MRSTGLASHEEATLPDNVQRSLLLQDIVRWISYSTGARRRGSRRSKAVLMDRGDRRFRRCSHPHGLRASTMEGALGCRGALSLTRRRAEAALVPARGGRQNPRRAGATESVRGGIKPSSPVEKAGTQGASLEETEATGSSGSSDAGLLEEEIEGHLMIHAEAGGSSSNEAPLDHVLRQGFGRAGSWKLASPVKTGGEGDSRIERSIGCSSCRSVAEVGRTHLPRRGEAGR